jgi:peptide/nickel transport system permease protein
MGTLMISSIHDKDLYVLMGLVLVSGILVLLGNWLSDVLLAWSDPRIRL